MEVWILTVDLWRLWSVLNDVLLVWELLNWRIALNIVAFLTYLIVRFDHFLLLILTTDTFAALPLLYLHVAIGTLPELHLALPPFFQHSVDIFLDLNCECLLNFIIKPVLHAELGSKHLRLVLFSSLNENIISSVFS